MQRGSAERLERAGLSAGRTVAIPRQAADYV